MRLSQSHDQSRGFDGLNWVLFYYFLSIRLYPSHDSDHGLDELTWIVFIILFLILFFNIELFKNYTL